MAGTEAVRPKTALSNRRFRSQICPPFWVSGVGVDTCSYAWRPRDPELWAMLDWSAANGKVPTEVALQGWPPPQPHKEGEQHQCVPTRRGGYAIRPSIHSTNFLFWPRHRLVVAEGRLAAMDANDENNHDLAAPELLAPVVKKVARAFEVVASPGIGLLQQAPAAVRRLDLAAELRFADPADGLGVLAAVAQVTSPGLKTVAWRNQTRTETVSFIAKSGRVVSRLYDKGAEISARGGDGPDPGLLLRWETQTRWEKAKQRSPQVVTEDDPATMWLKGFKQCAAEADGLVVSPPSEIERLVLSAAETGDLSVPLAERLVSTLVISRLRGENWWSDREHPKTGQRRRRELRKHGFVVAPAGLSEPVELGPVVEELRQAWGRPSGQSELPSDELRPKRKRGAKATKVKGKRSAA